MVHCVVVGVSQTAALNRGRHLYSAGRPSRWALAHISSVNLECRSEICCTRLAEKYRTQKSRQKSPSGHHRTTLSGYICAIEAHIDNRRKTCSAAICPPDTTTIWCTSAQRLRSFRQFGAPHQISTGFASWQRYCTACSSGRQLNFEGVEQRAPPMFGRATITLGIGPHFQQILKMFDTCDGIYFNRC